MDTDRLVCCDGGPHVLIAGDVAHLWRPSWVGYWGLLAWMVLMGRLGFRGPRVLWGPAWGLYARACGVRGDVGTMRFGRGRIVVLGGSPPFSAWAEVDAPEGGSDGEAAAFGIFALESWTRDPQRLMREASAWMSGVERAGGDGLRELPHGMELGRYGLTRGGVLMPASDHVHEPVYGFEQIPMPDGLWRGRYGRYSGEEGTAAVVRLRRSADAASA